MLIIIVMYTYIYIYIERERDREREIYKLTNIIDKKSPRRDARCAYAVACLLLLGVSPLCFVLCQMAPSCTTLRTHLCGSPILLLKRCRAQICTSNIGRQGTGSFCKDFHRFNIMHDYYD